MRDLPALTTRAGGSSLALWLRKDAARPLTSKRVLTRHRVHPCIGLPLPASRTVSYSGLQAQSYRLLPSQLTSVLLHSPKSLRSQPPGGALETLTSLQMTEIAPAGPPAACFQWKPESDPSFLTGPAPTPEDPTSQVGAAIPGKMNLADYLVRVLEI